MYQSYLDGFPLADFIPPNASMNVSQAYLAWGVAARQVWLNVFAPNNREASLLRPSLLEHNLDSIMISYIGTLFFSAMFQLMRKITGPIPESSIRLLPKTVLGFLKFSGLFKRATPVSMC